MSDSWLPAAIIGALIWAMAFALHADLSKPSSPRTPSAPVQEQQASAASQNRSPGRVSPPVESVPRQQHAAGAVRKKDQADDAATEQTLADATWKLAYFTLALAVIAGCQIALFLWQLRLIRESLDDAKTAAIAAQGSAVAARDNADVVKLSMVANNRAYVSHAGFRWFSHFDTATKEYFWRIRPQWINNGNTPTKKLMIYIDFLLRDQELPADYCFTPDPAPTAWAPGHIPAHGVIESRFFNLTCHDMVAIQEHRKYFYVWGIAKYSDVYPDTPERLTKFFVSVLDITGEPVRAFDEKTNPLHMVFAFQRRHNCTDDECDGSEYLQ